MLAGEDVEREVRQEEKREILLLNCNHPALLCNLLSPLLSFSPLEQATFSPLGFTHDGQCNDFSLHLPANVLPEEEKSFHSSALGSGFIPASLYGCTLLAHPGSNQQFKAITIY